MPELETELKKMIVEELLLDDVTPEEIASEAPLFGNTGLGLDSIDALELVRALDKRFGVKIKAEDEQNKVIFASVKNLAAYVAAQRAG